MLTLRFEGTSAQQQAAIEASAAKMVAVAAFATTLGDARITHWFGDAALSGGANFADCDARRKKMSGYLGKQCSSLTFVNKVIGDIVDNAPCEHGDIAQVINGAFKTKTVLGQRSRLTEADGFVPSGLRIFMHPGFMTRSSGAARPFDNQFNTLMHEISHRVIATTDHWYGEGSALDAAQHNNALAVDCAENWGYFYADLLPFVA